MVRFREGQGVERIERIEEEVRVDLGFVEGQFGTVLLRGEFLAGEDLAEEFEGQLDGQREARHHEEEEPDGLRPHVLPGRHLPQIRCGEAFGHREMGQQGRDSDQHRHQDDDFQIAFLHEEAGYADMPIGEIEGVHIDHECDQEGRIVNDPAIDGQQRDDQGHDHQTEQQVDIQGDAVVFHGRRTFGRSGDTKIEFCGLKSHIREPEFVITFRKLVITCFPVRAGCSTFVETGICPFNRRASGERYDTYNPEKIAKK